MGLIIPEIRIGRALPASAATILTWTALRAKPSRDGESLAGPPTKMIRLDLLPVLR